MSRVTVLKMTEAQACAAVRRVVSAVLSGAMPATKGSSGAGSGNIRTTVTTAR